LKHLGFLEFLLNMLFSNKLIGIEQQIFALLYDFFLKSTKFPLLDKNKLQIFINFSYMPFLKFHCFEEKGTLSNKYQYLEEKATKNIKYKGKRNKSCGFFDQDFGKKIEKIDNLFLEYCKLLETPKRKSFDKILCNNENNSNNLIKNPKLYKNFEFILDFEKTELYKQCFLETFCKIFEFNENNFSEILNYKLILHFLYVDSYKLEISSKITQKSLLKCLYLSLQRKEDLKNFLEENDKKAALLPYCSSKPLYYYMFSSILKIEEKNIEKINVFEVFIEKMNKNCLDESEIQLAVFLLEISSYSFDIISHFLCYINKEENLKNFYNYHNKKLKRSKSFEIPLENSLKIPLKNPSENLLNNPRENSLQNEDLWLFKDKKTIKQEIFSFILSPKKKRTMKKKLLEYYNKIICKQSSYLSDEILNFPDLQFQILIFESLLKLFLKQKLLKSKMLAISILEKILKIEIFLKEIHEFLHKEFHLNEDFLEVIALIISQIGLLNESYEIGILEKNEIYLKLMEFEIQIQKFSSEKTFVEIILNSMQILEEICEENENNFNDCAKPLAFSFTILFAFLFRTNNFAYVKWSSIFILNLLKKYFFSEKMENSFKKTGLFGNFLMKLGINDQNSKKSNIKQNKAFLNEIQLLLKKSVLILLKLFENINFNNQLSDELLKETFYFLEDNETIIFNNPCDSQEFFNCFIYAVYKFSERS